MALVFEGPTDGSARAVFADHSHRIVGEFANAKAAQRAAEGFARKWLRSARKIAECGCGDVPT
jgi:hypothetical protein